MLPGRPHPFVGRVVADGAPTGLAERRTERQPLAVHELVEAWSGRRSTARTEVSSARSSSCRRRWVTSGTRCAPSSPPGPVRRCRDAARCRHRARRTSSARRPGRSSRRTRAGRPCRAAPTADRSSGSSSTDRSRAASTRSGAGPGWLLRRPGPASTASRAVLTDATVAPGATCSDIAALIAHSSAEEGDTARGTAPVPGRHGAQAQRRRGDGGNHHHEREARPERRKSSVARDPIESRTTPMPRPRFDRSNTGLNGRPSSAMKPMSRSLTTTSSPNTKPATTAATRRGRDGSSETDSDEDESLERYPGEVDRGQLGPADRGRRERPRRSRAATTADERRTTRCGCGARRPCGRARRRRDRTIA